MVTAQMQNSANSQHHILRLKYSTGNCIFLTLTDKNMSIAQNKSDAAYDTNIMQQKAPGKLFCSNVKIVDFPFPSSCGVFETYW